MHIERDENESEKLDSSLEIKSSVFGIVLKILIREDYTISPMILNMLI